jgi:hypothetical protein
MGTGEVNTGLVGRPEVKRQLLEDLGIYGRIIERGLQDVRLGGLDWINMAQDKKD